MEYDAEDEAYKARMRKWGMHDKDNEDVTIEDCLRDLAVLMKIHGDRIKGVLVIPIYDHDEVREFRKQFKDSDHMDTPPSHNFLCSGGVPMMEAVGTMESVKHTILE